MTPRAKALQRIRAFEAAHEADLFSGAGDPDDRDWIREKYFAARERMIKYLMESKA